MAPLHRLLMIGGVMAAAVGIGLTIGSVWLNSFIHSEAFRREVEARASQTVGGPVEIRQIDFSIWSGVELTGVATKLDSGALNGQGTLVAKIGSVRCSYSLLALLSRQLRLEGVNVVKPEVVLTQLPPSSVPRPTPPPVPPGDQAAAPSSNDQTAPFQFLLETARVTDGHLSIQDAAGAIKADLQGVQLSARGVGASASGEATGTLKIADILLPQNLRITDFSTPFTYQGGSFQATPLAATAFSGQLTGAYQIVPGSASVLDISATGIDMLSVGSAANPNSSTRFGGTLALQSRWHGVETGKLTGEGDAQITHGRLQGVTLLQDLATALRVPGLSEPELSSVTAHFEVANGITRFSRLQIESADFEMNGDGTIGANGGLDANMVLVLHGGAMGGIPGAAATFFSRLPGGGGSIPFHLSGTVGSPHADLSTRLFLQGSSVERTINRTLNHLFH